MNVKVGQVWRGNKSGVERTVREIRGCNATMERTLPDGTKQIEFWGLTYIKNCSTLVREV